MANIDSSCIIFDKFLFDDSNPYTLAENNNNLTIQYGEVSNDVIFSLTGLTQAKEYSVTNIQNDIWYPIFINNDNNISNKVISRDGAYRNANTNIRSGRLGIENFISFPASLKNWSISGSAKFSIDWILNQPDMPYYLEYGILCWYKKIGSQKNNPTVFSTIDKFPIGSRLIKNGNSNTIYIKLDDDNLYNIGQDDSIINTDSITHSSVALVKLSDIGGSTATFSLAPSTITSESLLSDNSILWIANGDTFSYSDNEQDKNYEYSNKIISKSYISASLYSTYSQIYHILTSYKPKNIIEGMHLRQVRLIKKLASFLATSPFITDFHIHSLLNPQIFDSIKNFIDTTSRTETDQTSEIASLKTIINQISQYYTSSVFLESNISYQTNNNNLVYNKKELFQKLLSKYNANLLITGDTSLSFIPRLEHGNSIYFSQVMQNLCSKTLRGTKTDLQPVYNNQTIRLTNGNNNLKVQTAIDSQNSNIILEQRTVTKLLPLSDIGKTSAYDGYLYISMNRTGDTLSSDRNPGDPFDPWVKSGNEHKFQTRKPVATSDNPIEIEFSVLQTDIIDDNLIENNFAYYWEQLSGPKVVFSDSNYNGKFDTSTSAIATLYALRTGEYTIQCTVSTPYGTFIRKKTFYIVDGRQRIPLTNTRYEANPAFGKYSSTSNALILDSVAPEAGGNTVISNDNIVTTIPTDYLRVMCPTLSEIAIEQGGIFWPLKTNLNHLLVSDTITDPIPLSGSKKYFFGSIPVEKKQKRSSLVLEYYTGNTTIKIIKLKLANLRNTTEECSKCLSMFEPVQYGSRTRIVGSTPTQYRQVVLRSEKNDDGFDVRKFVWDSSLKAGKATNEAVGYGYPKITTRLAPPIKTYGGYESSVLDNLGINIPQLDRNSVLPAITGYNLFEPAQIGNNYTKPSDISPINDLKYCYQKPIRQENSITFEKGVFHPASGWIRHSTPQYNEYNNLSSVLKFNPGARQSFSFTGPGLYDIKSSYDRVTFRNIRKSYTTSVSLSIARSIQWDPVCKCEAITDADRQEVEQANQVNKEFADQQIGIYNQLFHGYRYLAGGSPKEAELRNDNALEESIDEFQFSASKVSSNSNGYQATYNYAFTVTGPNNKITSENIAQLKLRNARINNLKIEDIEVKLNFLNYVNTKNLIIWLEMTPYDGQGDTRRCPVPAINNAFINNNKFTSQYSSAPSYPSCTKIDTMLDFLPNTGLVKYIDNWTKLHSSSTLEPLKLCLLNQEHIQNNKYNFSIKFSDHALKSSAAYDANVFADPQNIAKTQEVINDSYELAPSITASGYSDIENTYYQSIIKNNQINLVNNSFVKFKGKELFANSPQDDKACTGGANAQKTKSFDGITTFTLHIDVLDEYDDMRPLDLVNNNDILSYYETNDIRQKSADIINSLCSWELILHTEKTRKYIGSTGSSIINYGNNDVLSLIEYGEQPKYPGYNFIADFANKKYLIPRVNLNAPYTYINDYSLCDFISPTNKPKFSLLRSPDFPTAAIIGILASLFTGTTGSIIGTALGPGVGYNIGFQAIIDYFNQNRLLQSINRKVRNIYSPKYDNFPFGSAEKVLLNISKDGGIWYKVEAPIFKYDNCPVLEQNKYKFVKLSKNSMSYFSQFQFEKLSINDLIDDALINLSITNSDLDDPNNFSGILDREDINSLPNQSIFSINVIGEGSEDINGLYVIEKNDAEVAKFRINDDPKYILKADSLLHLNNLVNLIPSDGTYNFIGISSKIPFYIFNVGDSIDHYTSAENATVNTTKITGKSLVIKNNKYYTILNTNSDISSSSIVSPNQNDTIVVFKPQTTKFEDKELPISCWGLEKEKLNTTTPEVNISTIGLGSYGDGSPFKNKKILSYNLVNKNNKLQNIYELLNNHDNDRIKFNNMTLFLNNNIININNTNGSIGYACTIEDIKTIFLDSEYIFIQNSTTTPEQYDAIIESLKNSTTTVKDMPFQIIFVKCSNLSDHIADIVSGDISFEQDLIKSVITNNLPQDTINTIVNRIRFLESENTNLANIIGQPEQTSRIISSGSIKNLEDHYNSLDADPIDCYNKNSTSTAAERDTICRKKITKQALYNRYNERNELLALLDQQTTTSISSNGVKNYHAKPDNSHILHHITTTLINNNGILSISRTNNNADKYWINIDPKQSCSLAEDATVKVLKKIVYRCDYANVLTNNNNQLLEVNNNICPQDVTASGNGMEITTGINKVEYKVFDSIVEQQKEALKSQYSSIAGWKLNYTIDRQFMINNDAFGDSLPKQDIFVTATETYDLAIPCHMTPGGCGTNDGSADINGFKNPPSTSCSQNQTVGYKYRPITGSGLINSISSRTRSPTRVYNIFNLDNENSIKVQFRKVPRQIRGIDYNTTLYRYGTGGATFRPLVAFEAPIELIQGYALNNNFYCWECLQLNSSKELISTLTTDFLKAQNEMMFRAFYGSVDGIESKQDLQSLFSWEMIPYEYDT